ncbi:Transcriptional coactivator p15 domain-containing protein [Spironucleus salmonicida]|uniref:Transcriptional coactivator p15 domain-containing protein n=1 Tax=Spironucleus salmonicida TaxID=348837 RepID=V6LFR5_9EUKA|nr:Transcriptional coactivator p15 domain-containing protein [Spironucleus salmonicida]|eukprot:EST42546.1 Transcriptional coactivator p15 domain-containing protein [Spironucleus salmonicida]
MTSWDLKQNMKVTISEFHGQKYIDIRKYYDKDGEQKPTKQGISLSLEEFKNIMDKKSIILELFQ